MKKSILALLTVATCAGYLSCKKPDTTEPAKVETTFRSLYPDWDGYSFADSTGETITPAGYGTGFDSTYGYFAFRGQQYKIEAKKNPFEVTPENSDGEPIYGQRRQIVIRNPNGGYSYGFIGIYSYNGGRKFISLNPNTPKTIPFGVFVDSL